MNTNFSTHDFLIAIIPGGFLISVLSPLILCLTNDQTFASNTVSLVKQSSELSSPILVISFIFASYFIGKMIEGTMWMFFDIDSKWTSKAIDKYRVNEPWAKDVIDRIKLSREGCPNFIRAFFYLKDTIRVISQENMPSIQMHTDRAKSHWTLAVSLTVAGAAYVVIGSIQMQYELVIISMFMLLFAYMNYWRVQQWTDWYVSITLSTIRVLEETKAVQIHGGPEYSGHGHIRESLEGGTNPTLWAEVE